MIFPSFLRVYGDVSFRGECPVEDLELSTFFNEIVYSHPNDYHKIIFHVKNEGKKTIAQAQKDKVKGQKKGVSDIIAVGCPALCIEMKRMDHTQSSWEHGQQEFLEEAHKRGAFVCVALGYEAAIEAFNDWRKLVE